MSTPTYQGSGQPAVTGGGLLDGLLGTNAPAYAGNGQPSSATAGGFLDGLFGSASPAYLPAPASTSTSGMAPQMSPDSCADPFGSGPIAIVIPRQG